MDGFDITIIIILSISIIFALDMQRIKKADDELKNEIIRSSREAYQSLLQHDMEFHNEVSEIINGAISIQKNKKRKANRELYTICMKRRRARI